MCGKANANDRFCRTGASSSWVVPGLPKITEEVCEDCAEKERRDPALKRKRELREQKRIDRTVQQARQSEAAGSLRALLRKHVDQSM